MTGALHCRDRVPTMLDSYNDFIDSKRDYLVANQYVVRAAFIRGGGVARGGGAYTNYETSVGNKYANHAYGRARCEMLGAFARWGADAEEADLPHLITGMAGSAEPRLCPAPVVMAVRPRPLPPIGAGLPADPTERTAALIARVRNDAARPMPAPMMRRAPMIRRAISPVEVVATSAEAAPEPINPGPPEIAVAAEAVPASAVARRPVRAVVAARPAPVSKPAAPSQVDAAQALADAAKSLAAAAAAMQAQRAATID